uniref:Senescence-associated family protein n=1 Tax=Rhizophora mucronata TaxID=61149 RepID=A0A2P2IS34_RHIMU
MKSSTANRRPCFIEEDDGLASLADMEAGFSGSSCNNLPFYSRSLCYARKGSLRNLSLITSVSSPRSARFYDARYEDHQPHFLETCLLCKRPLGDNRDIFMYRDIPFCTEDCRQEQMEMDEAKEKNWNLSSSVKALRKKDQNKSRSSPQPQDYPSRTGTVAAA